MSGYVYRCYDRFGELLYIGSTTRPIGPREEEHTRQSPWWSEVTEVTYEEVDGWLVDAERAAIRRERPRYNVQYQREADCGWCDERRCVMGPGYALVACPNCSGGAWWPPFPWSLGTGPELYPEIELAPNPCGHLAQGYVEPTGERPTGLASLNLDPIRSPWLWIGSDDRPPAFPAEDGPPHAASTLSLPLDRRSRQGVDPSRGPRPGSAGHEGRGTPGPEEEP